ncbi:MAG: bifunctional riboflavin kinase/FAD synthetase, partial [Lachnospiraceae bacterium]|nr:bifunctional riboflavin kinase/FAD synthetase [Lachnospiraceae bacterium]
MEIVAYDKAEFNNTAVALGKFEGIHKGHMLLIDKITKLSHMSVVFTINMPEEEVINLDHERYDIFDKCGVDVVCECPFDERISKLSPEDFIKNILCDRLGAAFVVVGSDFRFGYKRSGDTETLKKYADIYGYRVIVFDKLKIDNHIVSSTYIRSLLDNGEVDKVIKYMGRPYYISGEVTYGKRLGRTIGFPTVNLIPDSKKR